MRVYDFISGRIVSKFLWPQHRRHKSDLQRRR